MSTNDFEQLKTGIGNISVITEETISRIPKVKAFSDEDMNDKLFEHHANLLRKAMNKNESNEVGLFWNLNDVEAECLEIYGKINGFNMRDNEDVYKLVNDPASFLSVIVMHNHPRNGLFSSVDLKTFADFDSIYMLTAVCNDGTIYMIRKEMNFNPFLLEKYYNEGAKTSVIKANEERMRKAKKMGLNIANPIDAEKIKNIQTKPYYYGTKNVAKHAKEIGITYRCSVKRVR